METVVAGSLRSNLYDLYEAQNWGFATEKVGALKKCRIVTTALCALIGFSLLLLRRLCHTGSYETLVFSDLAHALRGPLNCNGPHS